MITIVDQLKDINQLYEFHLYIQDDFEVRQTSRSFVDEFTHWQIQACP